MINPQVTYHKGTNIVIKTMPRVVADIDSDLKDWLRHHAIDKGQPMGVIIADLIAEYRDLMTHAQTTAKGKGNASA